MKFFEKKKGVGFVAQLQNPYLDCRTGFDFSHTKRT